MLMWWGLVGSALGITLDEAVTLALEHNLALADAREQQTIAVAQRAETVAAHLPSVEVASTASVQAVQLGVPPALEGIDLGGTSLDALIRRERWDATVTVAQPLVRPSLWSTMNAAKAQVRAASAQVQRGAEEVRARTVRVFVGLELAREAVGVATDALAVSRDRGADVARRVARGLSSERDQLVAERDEARAARELAEARTRLVQAENGWRSVVGVDAPDTLTASSQPNASLPTTLDEAQRRAAQRWDLVALDATVEAAQSQRTAHRRQALPTVDVALRARVNATPTLLDPLPAQWGAGVQVRWDVFDGGIRDARARAAAAEIRRAEHARTAGAERVRADVDEAWAVLQERRAAATEQARAGALADADLATARRAVAAGLTSDLEVREAAWAATASALARRRSELGVRVAESALLLAMGER